MMLLANASNGLALVPLPDAVSAFLSSHAHHYPYRSVGAMPPDAILELLRGGVVSVVDGSKRKPYPDSLVTGVGTWALVFGRAVEKLGGQLSDVPWATREMLKACWREEHEPTVKLIRRLARISSVPDRPLAVHCWPNTLRWGGRNVAPSWPLRGPAIVVDSFAAPFDDDPEAIARRLTA